MKSLLRENKPLLREFASMKSCGFCRAPAFGGCDPHHVTCRGMGGGGRLDARSNLLNACRECHRKFHDGKIAKEAFEKKVAVRERCTLDELRAANRFLSSLPNYPWPSMISGGLDELEPGARVVAERQLKEAGLVPQAETPAA